MKTVQRPLRHHAAALAGGALVLGLFGLDAAVGSSPAIIALLLAGPVVAATAAAPRPTMAVAALAVAVGLQLVLTDARRSDHLIALAALALGSAFAVLASIGRRRYETALRAADAGRVRSDFAARTGRLLEAPPDPDAMLAQVVRLAVPDTADMCVVDLYEDGLVTASVAHAADPEREHAQQAMRDRYPPGPNARHPAATVLRTGEPVLLDKVTPERLRQFATDPAHYELMLRMRHESAVLVPMVARGRTLGVMTLSRFDGGQHYTRDDVELANEVARRAALALDNARLFGDLQRTEAQLEAVLGNLAEAVTVQRPDGELVYVNAAAARTLWLEDAETVLGTPVGELRGAFLALDEHGRPVDVDQLPGRQALLGDDPEPLLLRTVRRTTGEQRWMLVKSSAITDDRGEIVLAVNVIEDVTDQRLAERQQTFLAAASKLLSASLDLEVTYEHVAAVAVPELADWCCVDVLDDHGVVRRAALAAADDERPALDALRAALPMDPDDPASIAHLLRTGRPVLAGDVDEQSAAAWTGGRPAVQQALAATGTRSALAVPMRAGDRIVGMITLGTTRSRRRLEEPELALALELGARAGIATENARVHAARSHIATTLQRSLLPPRLPVIPGLTIAARFRAAGDTTEVGGDFYDLFAPATAGWSSSATSPARGPRPPRRRRWRASRCARRRCTRRRRPTCSRA